MPIISFERVSKTYPKQIGEKAAQQALTAASFTLKQGETLGLIGQNGAGKSTCIRLIMNYMRADQGNIRMFNQNPGVPEIRQRIGYLPETSSFPQNLTCMELLRFAGRCCNMNNREISEQGERWLQRLDLWDHRNRLLRGFSKGMQQRASFAAALIHNPDLLILDEPMSGLDPIGRAKIITLIEDLHAEQKSILFCSHLLDDVERITNRIAILHFGKILFEGKIKDICQDGESLQGVFMHTVQGEKQ